MASLDIHSGPFSSDEFEEGGADTCKENMQYAVLSCTRQLVEKSEEVLQVIAADQENTQGDIQEVKTSLQSVQAEQKKIALMLEKVVAGGGSGSQTRNSKQKVNREVSVSTIY